MVRLEENWRAAAKSLADVAANYQFDGWLINVEAHWKSGASDFVAFLKELTQRMQAARGDGAIVMYYDSLDASARNRYQNALDRQNELYFDASQSLLTNYWYDKAGSDMRNSAALAKTMTRGGMQRAPDVLIGVDCFARGTYYHSGINNLAKPISQAHQYGLSLGMFAPGWTYETFPAPTPDNSTWRAADKQFWQGVIQAFAPGPGPAPPAPASCPWGCRHCKGADDQNGICRITGGCVSKSGWCGTGADYCNGGTDYSGCMSACPDACFHCKGADDRHGVCSIDGGCVSKSGLCGTGADYCNGGTDCSGCVQSVLTLRTPSLRTKSYLASKVSKTCTRHAIDQCWLDSSMD